MTLTVKKWRLDIGATILAYIFSNFLAQIGLDIFGNHILDQPIVFAFLFGILLLAYPTIKNKSWASLVVVNYWATTSAILAFLWGPYAGFRYQGLAAILSTVLIGAKNRDRRFKLSLIYQGCLWVFLEASLLALNLPVIASAHPTLVAFNYLSSTVFVIWISSSILKSLLKAHESAVRSEREAKFISASLGFGTWKFYPQTNQLEWDDRMYELYDADPKAFSGAYSAWENSLTPEAKETAVKELGLALSGEKEFSTAFQIRLRNGGTRHIAARGIVYRDESQQPTLMIGLNWDITELIQAEEKLKDNQRLLTTILETLPIAVFGKDIQNGFQWKIWNKGAEELFGLKAKDCIGKFDSDFFPKEQADFFREKDIETSKCFGVIEIPEEPAQTSKGTVTLRTKKTVIRNENGEPKILLGITEDITQIKLRERQIIDQKKQLELITDNFSGPVSHVDREGRYVFVSKVYERWFGISREKIIGKKHREILDPETFAKAEPNIKRALEGEHLTYEAPFKLHNGELKHIYAELIPNFDTEGKPDGFFTVVHDVTPLKMAQAQVIQASKLASLGEMSAGIAHEINNPLTIISGTVAQLHKVRESPEKLDAKIEKIQKAVVRISKIIKGLRIFSRDSEGSDYKDFTLSEIVKEALVLTENKSKVFNTSITTDFKSQELVHCNQVEIEQVLVNLISNAIDAVKNLSEKWVKIEVFDAPQSVILRVSDSGNGIPESIRNKIFDPFFTTKEVGQGTGLGLSITKGILNQHKATISVVSESTHTCFEIRFPRTSIAQAA